MTDMKTKAKAIMEAYYNVDTTEEEGIVALLREVANQLQYYSFGEGADMIVDAQALYELADELEVLK